MTDAPYTHLSRQKILANFDATVHERVSFTQEIAAKKTHQPLAASNRHQKRAQNQRNKEPSPKKIKPTNRRQPKTTKGFHNEGRLHKKIEQNETAFPV